MSLQRRKLSAFVKVTSVILALRLYFVMLSLTPRAVWLFTCRLKSSIGVFNLTKSTFNQGFSYDMDAFFGPLIILYGDEAISVNAR